MPNTVLKNGKQKRNFIWKQVCKIVELLEPSLPRSPERPSLPRSPERHVTSRHDSRVPSPELGLGSCSPQVCWSSFYLCGSLWDLGHHILEMHTGASHNTLPPGWSAHSLYRTISGRKSLRSYTGFWCTLHISGSCLSIPVECVTCVRFNRYHFESLYDPLETFRKNTSYTNRRCIYTIAH